MTNELQHALERALGGFTTKVQILSTASSSAETRGFNISLPLPYGNYDEQRPNNRKLMWNNLHFHIDRAFSMAHSGNNVMVTLYGASGCSYTLLVQKHNANTLFPPPDEFYARLIGFNGEPVEEESEDDMFWWEELL